MSKKIYETCFDLIWIDVSKLIHLIPLGCHLVIIIDELFREFLSPLLEKCKLMFKTVCLQVLKPAKLNKIICNHLKSTLKKPTPDKKINSVAMWKDFHHQTGLLQPAVFEESGNIWITLNHSKLIRCGCDLCPFEKCLSNLHYCICYLGIDGCQAIDHDCTCHLTGVTFCQTITRPHECVCHIDSLVDQCLADIHLNRHSLCDSHTKSSPINLPNDTLFPQPSLEQTINCLQPVAPYYLSTQTAKINYCFIDCHKITIEMIRQIEIFTNIPDIHQNQVFFYCLHGKISNQLVKHHILDHNMITGTLFSGPFCVRRIARQTKPNETLHIVTNNRMKFETNSLNQFESIYIWTSPNLINFYRKIRSYVNLKPTITVKDYYYLDLFWSNKFNLYENRKPSLIHRIITSIRDLFYF